MLPFLTQKVQINRAEFLNSFRLGIDFGDKAHGIAVVNQRDVVLGATLLDGSKSDLKTRNTLRRGRRTRESRRQRLARFRQWCLRNHLPDPDPYFNKTMAEVLWPRDAEGQPQRILRSLTKAQRQDCRKALLKQESWRTFLTLPEKVVTTCALANPFIARRLAREGKATPLVFVRALWHLFEHRGFDWYNRVRGEDDDIFADKGALLRHLKTVVITDDEDLASWKSEIEQCDSERASKNQHSKAWATNADILQQLGAARQRGTAYPTNRRLNPPRHYVAREIEQCLASLPTYVEPKNSDTRKKLGDRIAFPLSKEQTILALLGEKDNNGKFTSNSGLLNWNRREPRFDNRQLRGCTWCAARGIQRNTPRNKNVPEWHIKAAIRDIKVASAPLVNTAGAPTTRVSQKDRLAINCSTRWLDENEFMRLWSLVTDAQADRKELKKKLDLFFAPYAKLPKRIFASEGQQTKKVSKLTDPYQWHREELLNLAEGWKYYTTRNGKKYQAPKGRSRLCTKCLQYKANTAPDARELPQCEAEVVLSQRALKARCDRLIAWLRENVPPDRYPISYIRIEAVLPRSEDKVRMSLEARKDAADQSPRTKLKLRLMEEVGAQCVICDKPYNESARRGADSKRDTRYCQCTRPDLKGICPYCERTFLAYELQIEHIFPKNPISPDGDIGPDIQPNKTISCEECNQQGKRNRLPYEYFQNVRGGNSWQEWQARVASYRWSKEKKSIALLTSYDLPEGLGDMELERTGQVHRYLRQQIGKLYFPELDNPRRSQRMSTPAGWLTSRCRLDWEHESSHNRIMALVPRKSPLPTAEQAEERLRKRISEIDQRLPEIQRVRKEADIRKGFVERERIESALRSVDVAVCDRTNLNHHWIDAAVLASFPPQANQRAAFGGLWVVEDDHVRADRAFAPRAADYLRRVGDGSAIVDIQNRTPRFTARQQETTLYGRYRALQRPKPEPAPKTLSKALALAARQLPDGVFCLEGNRLSVRPGVELSVEEWTPILTDIDNSELRKKVRLLFGDHYQTSEGNIVYALLEDLKVRDKDAIISKYWQAVFAELCEAEYEFPKSSKEPDGVGSKRQTEIRKAKKDECLPACAWQNWASRKNGELRNTGGIDFEEVCPPRHLRLLFKMNDNERVTVKERAEGPTSKRGLSKPQRICRMTSVGSYAAFDSASGMLKVSINPWKARIEQTKPTELPGVRIHRGDSIWLERGKRTGAGWYRITKLSPAKLRLGSDEVEKPKLTVVPAWLDLPRLVEQKKAEEANPDKRKKIQDSLWETEVREAELQKLSSNHNLRIKRQRELWIPPLSSQAAAGD